MAKNKETTKGNKAKPDNDRYQVMLSLSNRDALFEIERKLRLQAEHAHVDKRTGTLEVHFIMNNDQIGILKKEKLQLSIGDNLSSLGRERQKEVGKGDRFQAGKILPKGLGIKR